MPVLTTKVSTRLTRRLADVERSGLTVSATLSSVSEAP